MSTTFLSLPREIRDIIYALLLLSPSSYIAPWLVADWVKGPALRRTTSTHLASAQHHASSSTVPLSSPASLEQRGSELVERRRRRSRLLSTNTSGSKAAKGKDIVVISCSETNCGVLQGYYYFGGAQGNEKALGVNGRCVFGSASACAASPKQHHNKILDAWISLSLLRTCRQVYDEASELFWRRSVFSFEGSRNVVSVLKAMGQPASRRVERVQVAVMPGEVGEVGKALKMLGSRRRKGQLREVGILVRRVEELVDLRGLAAKVPSLEARGWFDEFLACLREAGEGLVGAGTGNGEEGVDKVMRCWVKGPSGSLGMRRADFRGELEETLEEMHKAWGGRLEVNGEVVWRNYVRVREEVPEIEKNALQRQ